MAGIDEAQAHDAVALDSATAEYSKFRAGLKQKVADNEAVAKKVADEREKQRDEKMSVMMTMVETLTCLVEELTYNLATECAARIKFQKVVQSWEEQDPGDGSSGSTRASLYLIFEEEAAEKQAKMPSAKPTNSAIGGTSSS